MEYPAVIAAKINVITWDTIMSRYQTKLLEFIILHKENTK